MFKDCSEIKSLDFNKLNAKNLTNINGIFMGCSSLIDIKINKLNIQDVKYRDKIFEGCKKLDEKIINSINGLKNDTKRLNIIRKR